MRNVASSLALSTHTSPSVDSVGLTTDGSLGAAGGATPVTSIRTA